MVVTTIGRNLSIAVFLLATDGFVMAADGLTSDPSTMAPLADDATKLIIAPTQYPLILAAVGKASVNGTPIDTLIADALDYQHETPSSNICEVLARVASHLAEEIAKAPQILGYDHQHEPYYAGVQLLAAGYPPDHSIKPEVWTVDLESEVVNLRPVHQSVHVMPPSDSGYAVEDLFDEYSEQLMTEPLCITDETYRLTGMSVDEVCKVAIEWLSSLANTEQQKFLSDGIGGKWQVACLQPNAAPDLRLVDIGPQVDLG